MTGPIPYQIARAVPGKRYVCELGLNVLVPFGQRRLAGPFDTEQEAAAASGAIEAEHAHYQARTDIWLCPPSDTEAVLPAFALTVAAASAGDIRMARMVQVALLSDPASARILHRRE